MVRISEIINQNPWWKHGAQFFLYDRHLEAIKEAPIRIRRDFFRTDTDNIYLLRGCRQIGKTTFIKEWIQKLLEKEVPARSILYLSLDFFTSRRELRNVIEYFLEQSRIFENIYIFLDEVTYLKDWNLELKYLWDSGLASKAVIVVTGSSGHVLREKAEQLPGRGLEGNEYFMKPLNFKEFTLQTIEKFRESNKGEFHKSLEILKNRLPGKQIGPNFLDEEFQSQVNSLLPFKEEIGYLFSKYMRVGGFPFVINSKIESLLSSNVGTVSDAIVETFIRTISGEVIKRGLNETISRRIIRAVVDRYGSRYSFTSLAGEIGSAHITVIDYLNYLENSFILSILYPYNLAEKRIKVRGQKKVFFQDPFLYAAMRSYVTGVSVNDTYEEIFEKEELLSLMIEGMVYSHLKKNIEIPNKIEGMHGINYFYNTKGREIDYIIRTNDIVGIEVKYKENVKPSDTNKHPNIDRYYILSKEDVYFTKDVCVIPVDVFLLMLQRSDYVL